MKTLARERDKDELRVRLRRVHPESVRRWGRMSAHEMVCHVADALRLITGQKPAGRDATLFERTILKWFVVYAPVRWPPGVVTSPELDQEQGGTRPVDFASDVADVEALLELVTAPTARHVGIRHPVFGVLSHAEWLRWAYLHTDHHLRQFGA